MQIVLRFTISCINIMAHKQQPLRPGEEARHRPTGQWYNGSGEVGSTELRGNGNGPMGHGKGQYSQGLPMSK